VISPVVPVVSAHSKGWARMFEGWARLKPKPPTAVVNSGQGMTCLPCQGIEYTEFVAVSFK